MIVKYCLCSVFQYDLHMSTFASRYFTFSSIKGRLANTLSSVSYASMREATTRVSMFIRKLPCITLSWVHTCPNVSNCSQSPVAANFFTFTNKFCANVFGGRMSLMLKHAIGKCP